MTSSGSTPKSKSKSKRRRICVLSKTTSERVLLALHSLITPAPMEEKASEGNVAYFSEYPAADLETRLVKHRDEDGRSLLHTAAAAGAWRTSLRSVLLRSTCKSDHLSPPSST